MKVANWIYYLIFGVFSIIIYGQTFNNGFNIDDHLVCENLKMVEEGVSGISKIMTTNYEKNENDGNWYLYRPLARVTYALEHEFFPNPPQISHIINVLLYFLTCVLIFIFIKGLVPIHYHFFAFVIVLVFLVHPMHTEVVCSLKNREEILSLLFSILALLSCIRFLKNSSWFYLFTAFFLFQLAILSKISAIPFVLLVILVVVYLKEKWFDTKYIIIIFSLILPIVFYFLYMTYGLTGQGRVPKITADGVSFQKKQAYTFPENPLDTEEFDTMANRLGVASESLMRYSIKKIYPNKLLAYYGFNTIPISSITHLRAFVYFLLHLGLLVFGIVLFFRRNLIGMGIVFFLGSLFPYLNIIAITPGIFGERFSYFASLGYIIALLGVVVYILEKRPQWKRGVLVVLGIYIGLLSIKSFDRVGDWEDKLTLLETDTQKEKKSMILWALLFKYHEKKYTEATDAEISNYHVDKAVNAATQMINIENDFFFPHFYLSEIYKHLKNDKDRHNYHRQKVLDHLDKPINAPLKRRLERENISIHRLLH